VPGPAPTPTSLLVARGNPHAKSRQKYEPIERTSAPEPPDFLSPEARAEWDYIVPRLVARGTVTASDRGLLAIMCIELAEYAEACREIAELKASGESYKGHLIDHPRVRKNGAFDRYNRAQIQFGLSPSAKARVQAAPPEKVDEPKPERPKLRIAR
jgi:P27 family predicted phage terminase small subunit